METTAKKGNRNLLICAVIAIAFILLWFSCNNRKEGTTIIETKEVKGSFPTVQAKDIEVKDIPAAAIRQNVSRQKVSNSTPFEVENFKEKYKITQKQYDSLLVVNRTLDSLANASNDKRYQEIYNQCKLVEFKHEFNNDTINITLTGLSRGAPQGLNVNYKIKPRKDTIQLKQMWCRVFLGGEVGINKELNQGTYKLNLTVQNAKNDLISGSFQRILNQNFYLVGYQKALFTINKRAKKK